MSSKSRKRSTRTRLDPEAAVEFLPSASQDLAGEDTVAKQWESPPWSDIAKRLGKAFEKRRLGKLLSGWGTPGKASPSAPLLAGIAVANEHGVTPLHRALADLAWGYRPARKSAFADGWTDGVGEQIARIERQLAMGRIGSVFLAESILWAHALPPLIGELSETLWKTLCQSLDRLARHSLAAKWTGSNEALLAGELALLLRLRLGDLASETLAERAADGFEAWLDAGEDSLATAVQGRGNEARLVLASALRQVALLKPVVDRKLKKKRLGTVIDLGCWVAAMTRRDGSAVFSALSRRDVRDDLAPAGLFEAIKRAFPTRLGPAIDAALGHGHSGGRLAWEVSLPESMWNSDAGGTAAMLPEWDVRRGRIYVDYHGGFGIEVDHGRGAAIVGPWDATIEVDGVDQSAAGPWEMSVEYSDDDVHYLEFEQRWTGGVRLQRQLMSVREDRCVLLADAVIRDADRPPARIGYISSFPVDAALTIRPEAETNELWLEDAAGRRRGLLLSLQSNEWRVGPSPAKFEATPDHRLRLQAVSQSPRDNGGSVYAPLWIDFQQRRFNRPRTYRRLTVGDALRIVDQDEAVAHRVQLGSEQWVLYRSLRGDRNRTFLGKHLIADFYCARFQTGDGSMEDLVTITSHETDDEPTGDSEG